MLNPQSHTSWGVSGLNRRADDASQKLEAGSKVREGMTKSAAQPGQACGTQWAQQAQARFSHGCDESWLVGHGLVAGGAQKWGTGPSEQKVPVRACAGGSCWDEGLGDRV